jgi:Ca2+-binding RTX toxin-like protein
LSANVENLELTGLANLKATGSDGKNLIIGNAGDNLLDGKNGFDTLMGGEGDDTLIGGGGIDKLIGGDGSDTYQISSTEDIIVETAKDGDQDVIETSVSYALGDNLEVMVLTGNTLDNTLYGNDSGNELSGEAGNDSISGMGGDDTLQGGEGNDTFDGGEGTDTVVYAGNQDGYNIIYDADSQTWLIEDVNEDDGDEGTDELTNVEFLQFADGLYDPAQANQPTASIHDVSRAEGSSNTLTSFDFTVSLSAPVVNPASIDYRVQARTAIVGVDYADTSGT